MMSFLLLKIKKWYVLLCMIEVRKIRKVVRVGLEKLKAKID